MFAQMRRSASGTIMARLLAIGAVAIAAGVYAVLTSGAAGASLPAAAGLTLRGSVPKLASLAQRVAPLDPGSQIKVLLPLRLPDAAALQAYVTGEYTPGNPNYRRFLAPAQFGARFGAATAEIDQATRALRALGLNAAPVTPNRLYLTATGPVAAAERAFGTRIASFRLPTGRTFYANTSDVTLPASLRSVATGVVGLDDSSQPQPQLAAPTRAAASRARRRALAMLRAAQARRATAPVGQSGGATPCSQAAASGGYTAPQLAQGYDFNGLYAKGFHGEGMSAALVEFDDYHDSNVATVESCYGISTSVSRRLVDGGTGGPPAAGEAEDMADIATILGLDPKLAHLYVYEAPITGGAALYDEGVAELDLYDAFVTDDKAPVLSASWGNCEETQNQSYDQLFATIAEEAAAQGQQIFDASGDSGAVDCRGFPPPTVGSISVEQEAAVPWITGVGGTDLSEGTANGTSPSHNEDTWNDGGAGGGGQSAVWTMPSWQSSYLSAASDSVPGAANDCGAPSGKLCRMVPDISMNADPEAGGAANTSGPTPPQFFPSDVGSPGDATYCGTSNCAFATLVGVPPLPIGEPPPAGAGGWYPIGGTSLATPTAAAAAVLWDQEAQAAGLGSFGFLNPSLYQIASDKTKYAADFHDITTDTNDDQYDTADCPTGCNPSHLYAAGTGYDMASGLGSVDIARLGSDLVKQAEQVAVTPSDEQMYGYLNGPHTTAPVSVTSGFIHSTYTATSNASWLHVDSSGSVPSTLSWYVAPAGLSSGTYHGQITVTGKGGSTTVLSVSYTVGPRASISVSPTSLHFAERAIDSSGNSTTPACGATTWNDELKSSSSLNGSSDTTPVDTSTRQTLEIGNSGPAQSTLHYEAFFHTDTSSWLTEDLNPDNNPSGFQTAPSQPLVTTQGSVSGGSAPSPLKLASIANANAVGGYPRMDQGTYTGQVDIRDLADPSVLVTVPVTLVLGDGSGTPTIAAAPGAIGVNLQPGKSTTVNLVLSDSSKVCGYGYSLSVSQPWVKVDPYLLSGTVGPSPATSPPASSDTGAGNGYTPVTISAAGLSDGFYRANLTVQSQNAVHNPTTVPITLTVGQVTPVIGPGVCTRKGKLSFILHPPHRARVLQALVYLNGRLVHRFRGRHLRRLNFAKPKARSFSLKIVTRLSDGERWRRTAHYTGCKQAHVKLVRIHKATKKRKKKRKKHSARKTALRPAFTG